MYHLSTRDPLALVVAGAEVGFALSMGLMVARHSASPARAAAAWLMGLAVLATADLLVPLVGIWDLAFVGAVGLGGIALAHVEAPRAVGASVVAGWALAELLGALALPVGPDFLDTTLRLRPGGMVDHVARDGACRLIFPDDGAREGWLDVLQARARDAESVVLHLGDSMLVVTDEDGPQPQRVPERLDAADAHRTHLNLGVPGTSLDVGARIASTWMAASEVDAVVAWVTPNNDLAELGLPLGCCPPRAHDPAGWCPTPVHRTALQARTSRLLRDSASPIAWRVWSRWSRLGAHVRGRVHAVAAPASGLGPDDRAEAWAGWVASLAREAHEADAELVVVVVPHPDDLRAPDLTARLADLARPHADRVLVLDDQIALPDGAYMDAAGHLSAEGHRRVAEVLGHFP